MAGDVKEITQFAQNIIDGQFHYQVHEREFTLAGTIEGEVRVRDFAAPLPKELLGNMELWAPIVGRLFYEVKIRPVEGKIGVIADIKVEPEYRMKGIGERLVAIADDRMRDLGALKITGVAGERVRPFWEKLGYVFKNFTMEKKPEPSNPKAEAAPEVTGDIEIKQIVADLNLLREEKVWNDTMQTKSSSVVNLQTGRKAIIVEPAKRLSSSNYADRAMQIRWEDGSEWVVDASDFAPSILQKQIAEITHGKPIPEFPKSKGNPISEKCLEQASHIYEAHEYGHWAAEAALRQDNEIAEKYLNLINEELYATELSVEAKMSLNGVLAESRKLIKEGSDQAAVSLEAFLEKTKRLMFEVAVECECGKGDK